MDTMVVLVYGETDSSHERRFTLSAVDAFQKVKTDFAEEMNDWRGEEILTIGQELRFNGASPHAMRARFVWVEEMQILTMAQAAEIAHKDASTLRRAIAREDLPAQKIGRDWIVTRADLDMWINTPQFHVRGVKAKTPQT